MRTFPALMLVALFVVGCTPEIPVKDAFGVSGQQPVGSIPPEFAEFNNYDPRIAWLLAGQICATPYEWHIDKSLPADPGEIVAISGRCQTYAPAIASLPQIAPPAAGTGR